MKSKLLAIIREAECIGCTKCIQACPVDCIVGTQKFMHTVIANECIGCELCIAPCPVDCIDLVPRETFTESIEKEKINLAKQRIRARKIRLSKEEWDSDAIISDLSSDNMEEKKAFIAAAVLRAKKKNF